MIDQAKRRLLRGFFHVGQHDAGALPDEVTDCVVDGLLADLMADDSKDQTELNENAHGYVP